MYLAISRRKKNELVNQLWNLPWFNFCILIKQFQSSCHLLLKCWYKEFAVNSTSNCTVWSQAHILHTVYICLLLCGSANEPVPAAPTPSFLVHSALIYKICWLCRCECESECVSGFHLCMYNI